MRSSTPRELMTVAPSANAPRNTRDSDSLPPWAVWMVRITCASAGPLSSTPSRLRVWAIAGASWRTAFRSRVTPWPSVAEPISTGTTWPSRNSRARSSNTRSRGGSMSLMSCSISASS